MADLSVDIEANTAAAVSNVRKLADSLTDAEKDLIALSDAGERAGKSTDDIARDLSKLNGRDVKDVRQEIDRLDDSLRDLDRSAGDIDPGKKVGKSLKDGLSEAKNEAGQSGREAAASFSGGFEDIVDFLQETAANAFGGFGPVGAAAGIAVAAAIGTILSESDKAQQKLNETREAASEMASQMYENGGKLPLTSRIENLFETLNQEISPNGPVQSLINQWVDFGDRLSAVRDIAEKTGRPVRELTRAMTGEDLLLTQRALDDVNAELDRMKGNVETAWVWETGPLEDYKRELESVQKQEQLAKDTIAATDALNVKQLQDLGEAWRNAATDAGDYFSETEDGATSFDWSSYLADAEATIAAADEMKARLVGLPPEIKAEAESIFASQGAVAANEYTKAYEGASAADQGRFIAAAAANGAASGTAQAGALQAAFGNPVLNATVRVNVDRRDWDNWRPNPKTGVVMATRARNLPEWE